MDDHKFEEMMTLSLESARNTIARGFVLKKTFMYSDLKYLVKSGGHMLLIS
jgi:hypothetical protein